MRTHADTRSLHARNAAVRKGRSWLPLEALESRTLLTVTIVNAKTATFTDVDGDLVTVAVTKGTLTTNLFTMAASGAGQQLQTLDLSFQASSAFSGTNLTISVKQTGSGNGLTNVGLIFADGNALGKTVVSGDLGSIDAGSVKSLSVFSIGRQGTTSQEVGGNLISTIDSLGSLVVTTDIDGAFVDVTGNLGSVKVGGSLIGRTDINSGTIRSDAGNIGSVVIGQNLLGGNSTGAAYASSIEAFGGSIANVTIGGSVVGGSAPYTSEVYASKKLGKVVIGGSLIGGDGNRSGQVSAPAIASTTVSGSLVGGDGLLSGTLYSQGSIGNVTIGGSVIGGTGLSSGAVIVNNGSLGNLGKVVILKDLIGGDYNGSGNATDSFFTGFIQATGKIAGVVIGGNVVAGNNSSAAVLESGTIRAGTTLGPVQINGSLLGSATQDIIISAAGVNSAKGGVAITSVLIGGSVDHARILAGFLTSPSSNNLGALIPTNGGAQIGKITVNGDWTASSVLAGVTAGIDNLPGTNDDIAIPGVGTGKAKIGSIAIAGQVFGTAGTTDHFGFVSSLIGAFSTAGVKATFTAGKDSIIVGGTDDVTILEV